MERFILLPYAIGYRALLLPACSSSRPEDQNRTQSRTKEAEEEEDEEDSLSGESMKNSFRSLALPKQYISTGIHRLVKGFKNFSQQFGKPQ
ncbi:hypothetical protein DVH24_020061 [Malus domestica]|uniref:Uncharacterized protein n=1 Tax=Malus domestica TaxID=3750 RepID=A0A498J5V6_MALDO|nr:hypothetical protein DVH24_020061 [Malus domestica]